MSADRGNPGAGSKPYLTQRSKEQGASRRIGKRSREQTSVILEQGAQKNGKNPSGPKGLKPGFTTS